MTGNDIIARVCAERGFMPDEVIGGGRRCLEVSEVRLEAVRRLYEHFTLKEIGRLLGISHYTVAHYRHQLIAMSRHAAARA
jgi:hypothetical protein